MKSLSKIILTAVAVLAWQSASLFAAPIVTTATFTNATGTAWNAGGNWSSNPDWPSGVGSEANFTGPSAARTTSMLSAVVISTINFDNTTTNNSTLNNGTNGSLTFDAPGTGPAMLTVNGTGGQPPGMGTGVSAGNLSLSTVFVINDDLLATVNQTNQASAAGGLNLTGTINGPGGFIKAGDGLATFGGNNKNYLGATVLNGGRMRISEAAQPVGTSSFTINAGGQWAPLAAGGTFLFGGDVDVPLNLNGAGPTTGPFAIFPGAIRGETNAPVTIQNKTTLQSTTLLHVEGATTGAITFTNAVSGTGGLEITAPSSSNNQGKVTFQGANSYQGGTLVRGGTLIAGPASVTAFGTGDVTISNATSTNSVALLNIQTGATNAIDDAATLSLAGGTAGLAELGAGIDEIIGALYLGGVQQVLPGTYGSILSGADYQSDVYFAGAGVVRLLVQVPEPAGISLLVIALCGGLAVRRSR